MDAVVPAAGHGGSTEPEPGTTPRPVHADFGLDTGDLIGSYRILRRLGAGAMGVVYEAQDIEGGERVALKTISAASPQAIWRFKREFRNLVHLTHENLVQLHRLFEWQGRHYLTMELVDGVDAVSWVNPDPHLQPDLRRVRHVLAQLALALTYLHERGYVHLDIKPTNVMVTAEGRLVLLDFGLTEELVEEFEPRHRRIVGTPAYMSPERSGGGSPAPEVDWYAVGVVLYECLTRRLPFSGSPASIAWAKRDAEAPRPSALAPYTPTDLDELCAGLLRRDPALRSNAVHIHRAVESGSRHALAGEGSGEDWSCGDEDRFVGREDQLDALHAAFARARTGSGGLAYVAGPAGVGKSALLRRFTRDLRSRQPVQILRIRCYQNESLPFKTLDNLVDAVSELLQSLEPSLLASLLPADVAAIVRLFPTLARVSGVLAPDARLADDVDDPSIRSRAFTALARLLANISARAPLILVIEDLQWADLESVWILEDLLAATRGLRLLILGSMCVGDDEGDAIELELMRRPARAGLDAVRLDLAPLDEATTRRLAAGALRELGITDDGLAEQIAGESRGLPLFVVELAQERATRRGGEGTAARATLFGLVASRIDQLPGSSRLVLDMIAVADRPLDTSSLARAVGPGHDLSATVKRLVAGKLLRVLGHGAVARVEPLHGHIRETARELMSVERHQQLHACLVEALRDGGAAPDRLVLHLLAANREREAGELALVAAVRAEGVLAFERAAALYSIARRTLSAGDERQRELEGRRGHALASAGHVHLAANAYLQGNRGVTSASAVLQRTLAARDLLSKGHVDEGLAVLRMILARHRLPIPTPGRDRRLLATKWELLRLRVSGLALHGVGAAASEGVGGDAADACWTAGVGLGVFNPWIGLHYAALNARLSLPLRDPTRSSRAIALQAIMDSHFAADPASIASLLDRARLLAGRDDDSLAFVSLGEGVVALHLGQWAPAIDGLLRVEATIAGARGGHAWELAYARGHRLVAHGWLGDLDTLRQAVPAELERARRVEDNLALASLGGSVACLLALAQDDPARAHALVDEAKAAIAGDWSTVQRVEVLLGRARALLYSGDGVDLVELLQRSAALVSWAAAFPYYRAQLEHVGALAGLALAGRTLAGGGRPRRSTRLAVQRSARRLLRGRTGWQRALGSLVRGSLAARCGEREAALLAFARAENEAEAAGMSLHAAAARHERGVLEGGDHGTTLREDALARLCASGVVAPERFMRTMLASHPLPT